MKTSFKSFNRLLCAISLGAAFAAPPAGARETLLDTDVTFFGSVVFQPGQEAASFKPRNPPVLLGIQAFDDGSLVMRGSDSSGNGATMDYAIADIIGQESGSPMLAFASQTAISFVFFSNEDGFVELDFIQDQGLLLTPLDIGDTRQGRAAEMEGGAMPIVSISRLGEIDSWVTSRFSGGGSTASSALDFVSSPGAMSASAEYSGLSAFSGAFRHLRDTDGAAFDTGVKADASDPGQTLSHTEWGTLFQLPTSPRNRNMQFEYRKHPAVCTVQVSDRAVTMMGEGSLKGTVTYRGPLQAGGREFRVYETTTCAEHIVVSPEGDIVYFFHVPGQFYRILLFDRGDTVERRTRESMSASNRFPGFPFPEIQELSKWCFAQPVHADPSKGPNPRTGKYERAKCPRCHGKGTVPHVIPKYGEGGPCDCGVPGCTFKEVYHIHVPCPMCE
ncbi:MAG: hypothetical protein ILM98_06000 [Kiritimatiellae bacterium]|nr:hypothetical protein [Kiritimatiellia bacterium]